MRRNRAILFICHSFSYAILFAVVLASCSKEKVKPRWKTITIRDNEETLKYAAGLKVYITDENEFFVIILKGYHEPYTTIYHSVDQGENWEILMTDGGAFGFTYNYLYHDGNQLYIAAHGNDGGKLITYDGNETNEHIALEGAIWSEQTGLQFLNESTGFVTGYGFGKTTDGGITWDSQFLGQKFYGVHFSNVDNGILLAQNDLLKTIDGGLTWDTIFSGGTFNSLYMLNDLEGVIGGDKIWLTGDGGTTWREVYGGSVKDVCLNENGHIYAILVNNEIVRSINKGDEWSRSSDKKDGFSSVHSNGEYTIAGISDSFENKKGKLVIMLLKN